MTDNIKYKGLRKKLANTLRKKGISDEKILSVIEKIPRHLFFDKVFHNKFAYDDIAFPIGEDQTISQPYTVAFQTSLLEVKKRHKILEIGTGSGYQTAVLCELGARVYSIERQRNLYNKTSIMLRKMAYSSKLFLGDGFKGNKSFAPYDSIIVTCGAPFIPEELKMQLKINGRMVIPVENTNNNGEQTQLMKLIIRLSEDDFSEQDFGEFRFVPMLNDIN